MTLTVNTPPATAAQLRFLTDLVRDRKWNLENTDGMVFETCMNSMVPDMFIAKKEASDAIKALLACPKVDNRLAAGPMGGPLADFPVSKYAVERDGVLVFCEVREWKNRKYFRRLLGSPGDWTRIKVSVTEANALLATIKAVGPRNAALAYSRNFVRCAACEAPLSDPDSRARGFGPICFGRY